MVVSMEAVPSEDRMMIVSRSVGESGEVIVVVGMPLERAREIFEARRAFFSSLPCLRFSLSTLGVCLIFLNPFLK